MRLLETTHMNSWEILLIALGLAMDCFAVSLGIGTNGMKKTARMVLRLAFHFGLFQGGMAFIGWLAGRQIAGLISSFDHWLAFFLLLWVGGRMVIGSIKQEEECPKNDPTRGGSLVALSVATSIDALAVGLSLAIVDGSIFISSSIIGLTSFTLSVSGYLLGDKLGCRFGKRMELLGGLLLIGIGIRVLLSHLLGI
jgi:putative Mn2+ efflux pump MntP